MTPRSTQLLLSLGCAVLAGPAFGQEPGSEPRFEDSTEQATTSPYRNPQGTFALSGLAGVGVGDRTSLVLGVGVGYAVVTGVLPGVRGLIIAGDGIGGELATTLTLTPPIPGTFTPFVIGEVGRRWDPTFAGWMFGVGGGVYLGEPRAFFNLQLGWIHRWVKIPNGETVNFGSPILGVAIRF